MPLEHRNETPLPGQLPFCRFEALVFADNFVFFMSEMYDLEWPYQFHISEEVQHLFDDEYEHMIEYYEKKVRWELDIYLEFDPRQWVYEVKNFYVYAERLIQYFERRPYKYKDFIQLCVMLCSMASYFSLTVLYPNTMILAYKNIYYLAKKVLRNGTLKDSTW